MKTMDREAEEKRSEKTKEGEKYINRDSLRADKEKQRGKI